MGYYFNILFFWLALPGITLAQDSTKQARDWEITPILGLQLWSSYTLGQEIFDEKVLEYRPVNDRINLQLRRSRIGIKGKFHPRLAFNLTSSADVLGRDVLAATYGGSNNGSSPSFRVWNAYVSWKIDRGRDHLHLTVGYQSPQIGRESITSALRVTSMEKAWSQNYLRRHLTGSGPGRAMGVNLGGLFYQQDRMINLSYNVGVFNPIFEAFAGNSTGEVFSLLLSGRMVLHLGDPEFFKYRLSHRINYSAKRKGVSIGVAAADQGATNLFSKNQALGFDLLTNWNRFNMDGEWIWMLRGGFNASESEMQVRNQAGHFRMSYNFITPNERTIEPVIMMSWFIGSLDLEEQLEADLLGSDSGYDQMIDVGLNYHLCPKLKIIFHYTHHQGRGGAAADGTTLNNYFRQSNVGPVRRGDWVGLGLVSVI